MALSGATSLPSEGDSGTNIYENDNQYYPLRQAAPHRTAEAGGRTPDPSGPARRRRHSWSARIRHTRSTGGPRKRVGRNAMAASHLARTQVGIDSHFHLVDAARAPGHPPRPAAAVSGPLHVICWEQHVDLARPPPDVASGLIPGPCGCRASIGSSQDPATPARAVSVPHSSEGLLFPPWAVLPCREPHERRHGQVLPGRVAFPGPRRFTPA